MNELVEVMDRVWSLIVPTVQEDESTWFPAEVSVEIVIVYPLMVVGGDLILDDENEITLFGFTVALNADPADIFEPNISHVKAGFNVVPDIHVQVVVVNIRGEYEVEAEFAQLDGYVIVILPPESTVFFVVIE